MPQAIEIARDQNGFPAKICVFANEESPEHVVDVSPGGIIHIPDMRDAFLLAHDGITAVIVERKLSDEFYGASADAPHDLIMQLWSHARERAKGYDNRKDDFLRSVNPVMRQLDQDYDELWPQFTGLWKEEFNLQHRHIVVGCLSSRVRSGVGMHIDGKRFLIRQFSYYIGDTTILLDARVTADELFQLMDYTRNFHVTQELLAKYPTQAPGLGNILLIKAEGLLETPTPEAIIRNLSIHEAPTENLEAPRYAAAWG